MALSGRPAEAYATLALAEGLAAALPGVRTRPEHGLRASRVLYHKPEIARQARTDNPVLRALHDEKKRPGSRVGSSGGGSDATLGAFLIVVAKAEAPAPAQDASPAPAQDASPTSPQATQGGMGEADIVFVLERAPSSAESAALRTLLCGDGAGCFNAVIVPAPAPAALDEVSGSEPAVALGSAPVTPTDQSTARVGGVVPSPERASGRANAACYLLCEVTADARWLLHKLVQLELNARALALGALGRGVSEAWAIPPHEVALVVAAVGVATPLGAPSSQQAPRVVAFIAAHLPFVAHMRTTGRLFFLGLGEEGRNTNVIVANLLLSSVALTASVEALKEDVAALKGDVAALKEDVAALKGDVAALKHNVAEILSLLRVDRPAVRATWLSRIWRRLTGGAAVR